MEHTSRERLIAFTTALDFPNVRKEWIDLFHKEYQNTDSEIRNLIDEVVNDDDAVCAGMHSGAVFHRFIGGEQSDFVMDMVVFVLYLWWRKNVQNDPLVVDEFPNEL